KHFKVMKVKLLLLVFLAFSLRATAQDDVMMQAFYWDVPVDDVNKNGTWWDNLKTKSDAMKAAGFTGLWVPAPSKGNFGIIDMGYGVFDHYDLGNYNQKGTIETRFGSRAELESMISKMHTNDIEIYADIILNHIYTNESESEVNPAVKQYVFDEAFRNGTQYQAFPTNEIVWTIPNAGTGDYYIQIKGYLLNWAGAVGERGYDIQIDWTGAGSTGITSWESEPNNGGGQSNTFPASGDIVQAHIGSQSDIDEYKITVNTQNDIVIRLVAKRELSNPFDWVWAPQENGYYPVAVWHNGSNLASTTLEAKTNTGINYVTHTGTGEPNYSWSYNDFHPVDATDWLGFPGSDEIITNTKFFGNDLNTFSTTVQNRLKDWGVWMSNEIEFDGYRLDFVRGFQESFAADWVNNLPLLNGSQRFIVGEYWGSASRIKDWVNAVATNGADVDGFDFPLKNTLKDMSNGNQSSFNMAWLNNAGMIRNNQGNSLPGTSVVTFIDNHDTGKEHDKWVTKDYKMAYAYMLTHEGRPCVFYPHYYGVTQIDAHDASKTVTAPTSLREDINKLMFARRTYLDGSLSVLSQNGNPYPSGDTYHVYAARRQGNSSKDGAIVVINNHDSQSKGLWVDSSPTGYSNLANTTLVNAFDSTETTLVQSDGRVYVSAPSRGYAIWVKQSDYVPYVKPSPGSRTGLLDNGLIEDEIEQDKIEGVELTVYPNPFQNAITIDVKLEKSGNMKISLFNAMGQLQEVLLDREISAGVHKLSLDASTYSKGMYYYTMQYDDKIVTNRLVKL
ncbi:MAG: alpha-amylase family glycosyl hydrolase, partial [Bacteroidota bacterium]